MFDKKRIPLYRGLATAMLSLTALSSLGLGIAQTWRTQVDGLFGTSSYEIDMSGSRYSSDYKTGEELMKAAKELAIREGAEGTVVMRNRNNVLPLAKSSTVALFGSAAYNPIKFQNPNNADAVDLVGALTAAGLTVEPTMKAIYNKLGEAFVEVPAMWGPPTRSYTYGPNTGVGDYDPNGFQIKEGAPSVYESAGEAPADWKDKVKAANPIGICVFGRAGGEGTTYRPGIYRDTEGNTHEGNPLALSEEELAVVDAAKETCSKVIVLLNTSCAMEIEELKTGNHQVDGIVYIGLPNDYQLTGTAKVLVGDVNPSGALADTYAVDSAGAPALMNFGGETYGDYESVCFDDPRWPGEHVINEIGGSFGGSTYAGGHYIVEAEGIYTGYQYYETRYFDAMMGQGKANSGKGSIDGGAWDYSKEVSYSFGHTLSYLPNTQRLVGVEVDKAIDGNVKATVSVKNESDKEGMFLAQLYVNAPYTSYDKTNHVEKSAIQFLGSKKITLGAGATGEVTISVPTKYLASYDYTNAKTYILDGGKYNFVVADGAHEAVNQVLSVVENKTGLKDAEGADFVKNDAKVYTVTVDSEGNVDNTTFSKSSNGMVISNQAANVDINYYLPGKVTYLSRSDWDATYPVNFGEQHFMIADSPKKDEWLKELRNQTYTVRTDNPVKNMDGVKLNDDEKFTQAGSHITDINDPYWDKLVSGISADSAIGAVIHGGSQSDVLVGANDQENIKNPIVGQADGPQGFSGTPLSSNNGEDATKDPYYVDPNSEAGKFQACINSQTLLGSSFSPDLALDWGKLLGNTGLWVGKYEIWGAGLNYHRSQYNGRNTEYPSEDPMLCNQVGYNQIVGSNAYGIISGPKHIGFNDQEYDRAGISVYMNEQKFRETDLRGFQGAIEDAKALGMMVAFNRIGATNAAHHVGMIKNIFRGEWGFDGLISTDMMNNKYYFNPESIVMSTVTMIADFAQNDSSISMGEGGVDKTWGYLSPETVKNDNDLVEQARQNLKYQLYAFARSAVVNLKTNRVTPAWESALNATVITTAILGGIAAVAWLGCSLVPMFRKEN